MISVRQAMTQGCIRRVSCVLPRLPETEVVQKGGAVVEGRVQKRSARHQGRFAWGMINDSFGMKCGRSMADSAMGHSGIPLFSTCIHNQS